MSAKTCKAILDLLPTDYYGIIRQAVRFKDGLYMEATLYASPPITQTDFKDQYVISDQAATAAIEGGKHERSVRNTECAKLLEMMSGKLIPYINSLYTGNRPALEKSGARTSAEPSPVPPPEQPNISRVARGPEVNSVKVSLVRGVKSTLKKRSRTLYRIFMFEKEDDAKGIEIGSSSNSHKLYGFDVPENVNRYYAVMAQNTGGVSPLSSKVKYYLLS